MADCDDYPELYFPDEDGNFIWEHPKWGVDESPKRDVKKYKKSYENEDYEDTDEYNTYDDWQVVDRYVKRGEKATKYGRVYLFHISQTIYKPSEEEEDEYNTYDGWQQENRYVKRGEKGERHGRALLFHISQTIYKPS